MQIIMLIYTPLAMLISAFTLLMTPRALKDLGRERQLLADELPGVSFDRMLEASYRFNAFLLLLKVLYYYLLMRTAGAVPGLLYGSLGFGLIHIAYLIWGRREKSRLSRQVKPSPLVKASIWLTAALTLAELVFLGWVVYLLLGAGLDPS